jgi:hypothetical protein
MAMDVRTDGWMDGWINSPCPAKKPYQSNQTSFFFTDEEKLSVCYLPMNFESGKYQKQKL